MRLVYTSTRVSDPGLKRKTEKEANYTIRIFIKYTVYQIYRPILGTTNKGT